MTEPSEAAKAKATEMLDADRNAYMGWPRDQWKKREGDSVAHATLATFIQQVSDAAKRVANTHGDGEVPDALAPFILPEPVDPLVEALRKNGFHGNAEVMARSIRDEFKECGLKIVEASHGG